MVKNKDSARRHLSLEPLHSLLFVSSNGTTTIPIESITPETVGEKAFGLCCLPKSWILPFFVISDELLPLFKSCRGVEREQLLDRWATHIIATAISIGMAEQDPIIARSSGCSEGLEERGKFYSAEGILNNICQPLTECLERLSSDVDLVNQRIPLVIQKYAIPISAKGHLSNERRFYKENRDWLGDFEEIKTHSGRPFRINLRNWRKKIHVEALTGKTLNCNLSAHISEILKIPAAWAYERGLRLHYEWVWDGNSIYLVQADREHEPHGIDPTKIYQAKKLNSKFNPKCLKEIDENHARQYNKIRNVFTYMKLGLPSTKLYVLDDQNVINDLASGNVSSDLKEDLIQLVQYSLVIRMDVATEDISTRQLLPRTNEVRELEPAFAWLKEQSGLRKKIQDDVVFIFHNFVPSISSAFALAAPGERKVQIEALWGLPEGLYYNAHDKYIVDTQTPRVKELNREISGRFVIQEFLRYKHFFVAPEQDGQWTTQMLKRPYDWRGSIQHQEWVKEIALESRRIAEEEGMPLSIMWFVGVPKWFCSMPNFPWYHEYYDQKISNRAPTHRTKTPFDRSLEIKTSADIQALQQEATAMRSSVRRIRIQPREDALLRDKNTLRVIGELAQKIDAVILLEGGVLSHAYYQLMKTNAIVEVLNPFEIIEDKQEFYKLVRDKVPANIERGGEIVVKTRLSGDSFLRALREKLVEESVEVLDAAEQDSIIGELADVSEVIDGILSLLGVTRDDLRQRQELKREKAGGFKGGLVLLETQNPLPTKKSPDPSKSLFDNIGHVNPPDHISINPREVIELSHRIDKWSDRREHPAATEVILRLVIPMVRDNWTANTPEMAIDSDIANVMRAKLIGTRLGSKYQVELSIFSQQKQLKLPI